MHVIAYAKMSKKARRVQDLKRRGSWNGVCPVTRRVENRKSYSRTRAARELKRAALQETQTP